jgi:DNA-binding transcriptional LysR family regulator
MKASACSCRAAPSGMRIRYIEVFYAVMQSGTVKGAADMLHISQPAATRLLQQAERHVGVLLFRRAHGRLLPTAEAHQLFPEVEQVYLRLDAVRKCASNLGKGSNSLLRVLCAPGLALEALPPALKRWRVHHPDVLLSLRTLHSKQITEALALREAELGFGFEPSSHPALSSEVIAQGRMVCVGPDVPRESVTIEALAEHPVIDLDPADPLGRLLHLAWQAHEVEAKSQVRVYSYHTAVELAAQGFGWALLDNFTAAYAQRHPALRCVPVSPEIPVVVHALRPQGLPSSAAVDRLVSSMSAVLNR